METGIKRNIVNLENAFNNQKVIFKKNQDLTKQSYEESERYKRMQKNHYLETFDKR